MENPNNISMNVDDFGAIGNRNRERRCKTRKFVFFLKFNLRLKMRIGHIEIKLKEKTNYILTHTHTKNGGVTETECDKTNGTRGSETENGILIDI